MGKFKVLLSEYVDVGIWDSVSESTSNMKKMQ